MMHDVDISAIYTLLFDVTANGGWNLVAATVWAFIVFAVALIILEYINKKG